jgi:very-short-patch-repair endonuclease
MTEAELRLWTCLRHDVPHKFRRQEPLGPYVCDFVCYSHRLVVEVDGIQHLGNPKDQHRDRELRRMGFRVERVWNGDVMADLDGVHGQIAAALDDRRPIHRHPHD